MIAQDDETIWSHLSRALLVSGFGSRIDLRAQGSRSGSILWTLAQINRSGIYEYADKHGVSLLLHSAAWPSTPEVRTHNPMSQGGTGASRSLAPRACSICVEEASRKFGYAWYQRRQNLAGVATCHLHGERLRFIGTSKERVNGRSSLALMSDRMKGEAREVYRDDFVVRYELALLMLAQRKIRTDIWKNMVAMCVKRHENDELHLGSQRLVERVFVLAGEEWLQENFILDESARENIVNRLKNMFSSPVSIYCWGLALAALFEDPVELSNALVEVCRCSAIEPLLKAIT